MQGRSPLAARERKRGQGKCRGDPPWSPGGLAVAATGAFTYDAPRMRTKLQSLDTAAASVRAGSLLGMTSAVLDNAPMAFLRALVRRRVGGLELVTLTGGGLNADLLIGAGLIDSYETCSCTLGPYGPAPNFQRAVRAGLINMKDST